MTMKLIKHMESAVELAKQRDELLEQRDKLLDIATAMLGRLASEGTWLNRVGRPPEGIYPPAAMVARHELITMWHKTISDIRGLQRGDGYWEKLLQREKTATVKAGRDILTAEKPDETEEGTLGF